MDLVSKIRNRFKAELAAKFIATACSGALTIALARLLEPDAYGMFFLAISILGIIELFSKLGIAKSTARYISNYKETDSEQIPHILRFGFLLNVVSISLVCLAVFITYDYIAILVGEPSLEPFLLIGILLIFFNTLMKFSRYSLQGFENIETSAMMYSIDNLGRLIFALGLVVLGFGALGALVGYILAAILASVFGTLYIYINYYRNSTKGVREDGIRRRLAKYMVPLIATDTADVLDKRFDTVLLGFFLTPSAVAFYTVGKQVVTFVEAPMSALGFTLSPTYGAQKAKGNKETAARIYEEALSHGLLLYIPAAAGLILVADPLIAIFFGNQYSEAVPVLQVLAIYAVLQSVTMLTSNGLDYLGRAKERAIIKGITSILNVILNIVLIPTIGVLGAAVSTVFTYSIYTFTNFYIMHTELDLRINWLAKHTVLVVIVSILMSISIYGLIGHIGGIVSLLAVVGLGIGIWTVLVVGLGILDIRRVISIVS